MTKQRKTHHKSRNGCTNCKKRRCDESKPNCTACHNFGITCSLSTPCISSSHSVKPHSQVRSGRGRPRKDWTAIPDTPTTTATHNSRTNVYPQLSLDHATLLLQFTQFTAQSLAGNDHAQSNMVHFWTHNVPRIGVSDPFVLHLMYTLAAHHLALSATANQKQHYKNLAERHFLTGTAGLTAVMGNLNNTNCGAAYIGATLLCYCNFAAGPSGSGDLFLCQIDGQRSRWLNLVSGVRLIRETFPSDILFAGLMRPLGPSDAAEDTRKIAPVCTRLGFARVDWSIPLQELRQFVSRRGGKYITVSLRALDELALIYEGVYGDELGDCNVLEDRQFVLGWLYRLDFEFVDAVQTQDVGALAVLAYFAVLLATMDEWWIRGWAEHVIVNIRRVIGGVVVEWPMDMVARCSEVSRFISKHNYESKNVNSTS